jgi:hypothetical protein
LKFCFCIQVIFIKAIFLLPRPYTVTIFPQLILFYVRTNNCRRMHAHSCANKIPTRAQTDAHTHARAHHNKNTPHTAANTHTHAFTPTHTYTHTYMCHTHSYIHTLIHTHTHARTHTQFKKYYTLNLALRHLIYFVYTFSCLAY